MCFCVHYGAQPKQRGAVSEVQPADTEVCVFSNEIYGAPDVPSYEDVCQRFRRVRPAPCQSHSGVLFYCLSTPLKLPTTTIHSWPLNLTTPTPLLSLSIAQTQTYTLSLDNNVNQHFINLEKHRKYKRDVYKGKQIHHIYTKQFGEYHVYCKNIRIVFVQLNGQKKRTHCPFSKSSLYCPAHFQSDTIWTKIKRSQCKCTKISKIVCQHFPHLTQKIFLAQNYCGILPSQSES